MKKIIISIIIGVLGLSLVGCQGTNTKTNITYNPNFIYTESNPTPTSLEDTVAEIYPSVVSIKSYLNNRQYSAGSGILLTNDKTLNLSYILTCYHVIENGILYEITINGLDKPIEAELVGGDKKNDIAILSIKGVDFNYARLSKVNHLRLASQVIAIGNPLGNLPGSVSIGYVSFLNREVISEDYTKMNLIQTDTAINSGNSGGGLFDSYGNLVGIVNAKFAKAGVEGLGFAIPIETAMNIVEDVFKTAVYDSKTNTWQKGYKLDSWELGFVVSDLISFPIKYVGIGNISTNSHTSGYNKFMLGDQIVKAYYKENNVEKEISTVSSAAFYNDLYSLDLQLGDKFYVTINRNSQEITIEIELIQFIPE